MPRKKRQKRAPTAATKYDLLNQVGTEAPFMALRHCFGLTRKGAAIARLSAEALRDMCRGDRSGVVCLNCGLSLREVALFSRIGPWPIICQPVGMRSLSRTQVSSSGGELGEEAGSVLYRGDIERMIRRAKGLVDFGAFTREMFLGLEGAPVLLPGNELGVMILPPGFAV